MFRLFLILLCTVHATLVSADELSLLGNQSSLHYSITKNFLVTDVDVDGELTNKAKKSLNGTIILDDNKNLKAAFGKIILTNPYFDSDNTTRDELVRELFQTPIEVTINGLGDAFDFTSQENHIPVNLTINNVNSAVVADHVKLMINKENNQPHYIVQGTVLLNRDAYNLHFTGIRGLGDGLIADDFALTFKFVFGQTDNTPLETSMNY